MKLNLTPTNWITLGLCALSLAGLVAKINSDLDKVILEVSNLTKAVAEVQTQNYATTDDLMFLKNGLEDRFTLAEVNNVRFDSIAKSLDTILARLDRLEQS